MIVTIDELTGRRLGKLVATFVMQSFITCSTHPLWPFWSASRSLAVVRYLNSAQPEPIYSPAALFTSIHQVRSISPQHHPQLRRRLNRDMVGVLSRTVADAARVFAAYNGRDGSDNQTAAAAGRSPPLHGWAERLDGGALRGLRIGVLTALANQARPAVAAVFQDALFDLRAGGELTPPPPPPLPLSHACSTSTPVL